MGLEGPEGFQGIASVIGEGFGPPHHYLKGVIMRMHEELELKGKVISVGLFNEGRYESAKRGMEPGMLLFLHTDKGEWIQVRMSMSSAAKIALFFDGDDVPFPTCLV